MHNDSYIIRIAFSIHNLKYSETSHIQAVWDQGVPVIVKVPVSMNPLVPV